MIKERQTGSGDADEMGEKKEEEERGGGGGVGGGRGREPTMFGHRVLR